MPMTLDGKTVLVCNCENTMPVDGDALSQACGGQGTGKVARNLCRAQIDDFRAAARGGASLVVACTQEAPLFAEIADEAGDAVSEIRFVNIREHAGWSEAGRQKRPPASLTAKMAALLAEAAVDAPPTPSVSFTSSGVLLVLGRDETAIEAARKVAGRLDVSVILPPDAAVAPPRVTDVPIFCGDVVGATGHCGAFELRVADYGAARPSSMQGLTFDAARQVGTRTCDLILDLRGGAPLFPAPDKRDGYFNPEPGNPAEVLGALLALTDLVGEFAKPRYVDYDPEICAHDRSRIVGCMRCLDACPTGAITPQADALHFDPYVCAGCGLCAAVCPTGAARYALAAGDGLYRRLHTLLGTYAKAGGTQPIVLLHDTDHGETMIEMMARFGRGLPAHVIPFAVNEVTQVGLDILLLSAAYGSERTMILWSPRKQDSRAAVDEQVALANAVLQGLGHGSGRFEIVDEADLDAVAERLYAFEPLPAIPMANFRPMGSKRSLSLLALDHLHRRAPAPVDEIALPAGAPFGAIEVDADGCTLCLACVGACPTGALSDDPDRPRLAITESACVQCGLCRNTCPEKVITLVPRMNFRDEARSPRTVNEADPLTCIRCGAPFAIAASLERVLTQLSGHSMFSGGGTLDRLRMCQDCRVVALATEDSEPLSAGPRPLTRTTDDYLRERELQAHGAVNGSGRTPEA